jgi:sec-independent protein translocase protein TatA
MIIPLANIFGPENWLVIAMFGLLLFGKRLPDVGRSLGKGIVEFKKGLAGVEEEVTQSSRQIAIGGTEHAVLATPSTAYKFDPYTGEPVHERSIPQIRFDPYAGKPLPEQALDPTSLDT